MKTLDKFGRFLIVCEGKPTLARLDTFYAPNAPTSKIPLIWVPALAVTALWQYEGAQCLVAIRVKSERAGQRIVNALNIKQQVLVKNATIIIRQHTPNEDQD